jgi:hypothetical protein
VVSAVSQKVVEISKTYLGPATESFLSRQCKGHLNIELDELGPSNLQELAKWVEVGAALIMDPVKATQLASMISSVT